MRRWFHALLFLSTLGRAAALTAELLVAAPLDAPPSPALWWLAFGHGLPDLFFLSTYSLLILFWAQLYYDSRPDASRRGRGRCAAQRWLRPLFVAVNVAAFAAFGAVAAVTGERREYARFRRWTFWVLAVGYGLGTLGVLFYGAKVARTLRPRSSVSYPTRRMVLRRVIALCATLAVVFAIRCVFSLLVAADVLSNADGQGYVAGITNRYAFDAWSYALVELVPSALILLLTRKRGGSGAGGAGGKGGDEAAGDDYYYGDEYGAYEGAGYAAFGNPDDGYYNVATGGGNGGGGGGGGAYYSSGGVSGGGMGGFHGDEQPLTNAVGGESPERW